ncbi:MAG: AI-2E family transporter [Bacteroidota bacterium]
MNRFTIQIALLAALFLACGYVFSDIVLYIIVSLIISTVLKPITNIMVHLQFFGIRIPRVLAVLLSFSALIGIIGLFIFQFIPLIIDQLQVLASLKISDITTRFDEPMADLEFFLRDRGIVHEKRGFLKKLLEANTSVKFGRTDIVEFVNNLISFTSSFFVGALAISFISFFLLYDKGILKRFALRLVPNAYFELTIAALYKIEKLLTNYIIALILQIASIFTLTAMALTILGMPYALTVAVFAAVINIIPFAGPLVGAIFSMLVGISTMPQANGDGYFLLLIKIGAIAIAVHLIDNIFLQPLIFGKSMKAHPLEIFVAIFAGAAVGGIPGMIAAIPVYTVMRVSVRELYNGYRHYHIFRVDNREPAVIR